MLKRGYGGKKDEKKAYKHFESACEAGIYEGCANLGIMYLKGQGVPQSNDRARSYLEVACKENERIACEHLKELGD